ncbi:CbtA family protein [Tropicibacter sp. S64]|uniref:CbtA family protein n=1 Tax=Tropicibacter sp. S64 TaxID=3415122 RepID=UPI003C7B0672
MNIRMLTGGLIAGCATGILAGALHFAFLQDIILQAELYESGELVHAAGAEPEALHGAGEAREHTHEAEAHEHTHAGATGTFTRNALTLLFACLIYSGYGLVMAAVFQAIRGRGQAITPVQGVLWGLAGFAVFQMAPAMGLSPNLPGTVSEDIDLRQSWWFATIAATGIGLALIFLRPTWVRIALGAVLIAIPHVIGAPQLSDFFGVAPPELSALFATRVIGVSFVCWAVLGTAVARLTEPGQ